MIDLATAFGALCLIVGIACGMWRLAVGPDIMNRLLAFDYLCTCYIGAIVLYSVYYKVTTYLEVVLIFSLLGFASVIAFMELLFAWDKGGRYE